MTRYFALLHGDELKRGPKSKILPAAEFGALLDAKELLVKVQEDARRYRTEVAVEVETLKDEGRKEGFEEGLISWAAKVKALEDEITKVRGDMMRSIIPVALQAAKKIVGAEMTLRPDAVADIVASSLKTVSQHRRITIYCSRADLDILNQEKERLRALFERLESLSIQEREGIEKGGCIIETEGGIINAQPQQLWGALEAAFESILKGA